MEIKMNSNWKILQSRRIEPKCMQLERTDVVDDGEERVGRLL
jgi:hypothetical protein